MRWNPYVDLRVSISKAVRATCKQCGVAIDRESWRAEAAPVVGKGPDLLHIDCAAKRASDLAQRKVVDQDPEWPAEVRAQIARFIPEGTAPAPRSFGRTPLLDVSYGNDPATRPCVFCGTPCPGELGAATGHAIRAFSIDGERRFHPGCVLQIAPGLCRRVVVEDSERWPAEVKALFAQATAGIAPTPRSPWRDAAGIPELQRSPSARAACRFCQRKIAKGELRLARERIYGMRRSPAYFHVGCYATSTDFHPRMLELVVLRAPGDVTREEVAAWADVLPPTPPEDDDVPPLVERLLTLYDAVPREAPPPEEPDAPKLTANEVEIPRGFFNQ